MTLETYLSIALLQMGYDAMQTYNAKMHYRVVSSLMLALLWPITNALMVACVVIRQRHNIEDQVPEGLPASVCSQFSAEKEDNNL